MEQHGFLFKGACLFCPCLEWGSPKPVQSVFTNNKLCSIKENLFLCLDYAVFDVSRQPTSDCDDSSHGDGVCLNAELLLERYAPWCPGHMLRDKAVPRPLYALYSWTYWIRLWVIREMILSPDVLTLCGAHSARSPVVLGLNNLQCPGAGSLLSAPALDRALGLGLVLAYYSMDSMPLLTTTLELFCSRVHSKRLRCFDGSRSQCDC